MRKLSEKSKEAIKLLKENQFTAQEISLKTGLSYATILRLKKQFKIKGVPKRKTRYGNILILKCKLCKRKFEIRTNDPDLYTPEVKKNWICLNCKFKNANK